MSTQVVGSSNPGTPDIETPSRRAGVLSTRQSLWLKFHGSGSFVVPARRNGYSRGQFYAVVHQTDIR